MKKFLLTSCLILLISLPSAMAQWSIGGGVDVLKTPFFEEVPKIGIGIEANRFFSNTFALTLGGEYYDQGDILGGVVGARYYLATPVFLRMRGILSANTELALGMGYQKALNNKWRFETMADYFAVNNDFAIRIGFRYRL